MENYMKLSNKKRVAVLLLVLALLITSLVSCTGGSNEGADTVSVTDALGRCVSVPKEPSRVAALLGSFADVWVLSGGTLCAAADDAWDDFGLSLLDAVNIGGAHSPSLELLLSADPDLVLASASTASNVNMRETLEDLGICVIYFDVDNFYDYLEMLNVCTDITGRKDLYEQNGLAVKAQIDDIKAKYASADVPESQRSVLLLRASSSAVKAKGSDGTVLGEMLADLGCVNIADTDASMLESISVETVIRQEPQYIFVVTMGSDTDAAKASVERMMGESPAWASLDAIKNGRMYVMDKTLFNLKPNARWAQAYGELYEILTK